VIFVHFRTAGGDGSATRPVDIGYGVGASTVLLAQAYPRSRFLGRVYHDGSVELAR
jgi:hypothetical protein